ncbi:MAG TPA: hybrid sensor histidine kinase/response regulator [Coriobacteriia bacterium]|nr:hybrid sensor histidine kinase/response regulator [Coriobacteriia bacterium]
MAEFDRSAFIGKFQEEAAEYLQRLNEGVIALESDPENRKLVEQMLRDAHTLKGSSRMVGLLEISDIAHRLEDIMVALRDGRHGYSPDLTDGFFDALDAVLFLTEHAGEDVSAALDVPALLGRLEALNGQAEIARAGGTSAVAPDAEVPRAVARGDAEDTQLQSRESPTVRVKTEHVDRVLNLVSEVVIAGTKAEARDRELHATATRAGEANRLWGRLRASLAGLEPAAAEALAANVESLQSALAEQHGRLSRLAATSAEDATRSAAVVKELQEQAMALRMLPVATVTAALPRAVRDLARHAGKDVELLIEGGDTELDRKVLEEINDPLIHIVRNAIDHGIETPEARRAAGKPGRGRVCIAARQEGDRIVIEVSDDGAGIDPDHIREVAEQRGYVTPAEAAALSDRQAMYLIFEPGFTTSSIITELSGRGVGMDVVREFAVEKLRGTLDVESTPGEGTTFSLTIPLTLALIRALLVLVDGQTFAVPTVSITETMRIDPGDVMRTEGHDVLRRERRTIPLVSMCDVLGFEPTDAPHSHLPVIVVGLSGQRMAFVVDAMLGEQRIVIKTLADQLGRAEMVAGVTVLGAGEVVPILDVSALMARGREISGFRSRRPQPAARQPARTRRILICEDSFTTRELERSIFEAAGYSVDTAPDGAQGLAKLKEGLRVDAVVTDVQMPVMTGFELARAIKADSALKGVPVVIVTSLERAEEKAEGIGSGADAYITKSVFNQDTLLDTVERLIG